MTNGDDATVIRRNDKLFRVSVIVAGLSVALDSLTDLVGHLIDLWRW